MQNQNMSERPLSPAERKARFKENHPQAEAIQKGRERARDDLYRFHILRNHLYGYQIPECVDKMSEAFGRVRRSVIAEGGETVEVVES